MRGPPLHPSWAERDDINRGPPRPALSTPSAPPQPAHRRPPLLPNCPNNLPGNLKPSSGQTTLSRIPLGSPFSNPSHSVGARMKISPFRENCNFSSLSQVLQPAPPSPPPSSHPHSQQPFYRSSISISFRAGWKSITGGGLCRPIGSRQPGGGGGAQPGSCCLAPTCWRHLLGQPGNFVEEGGRKAPATAFAGIPLHFADCRDNCRLPGHYFGDGCVPQILGESI